MSLKFKMMASTRFLSLKDHRSNSNADGDALRTTDDVGLGQLVSTMVIEDDAEDLLSIEAAPDDGDRARCFSTELVEP